MRSLLAAFLVLTGACTLDEARGTETTVAQDEVTTPPSTTGSTTTLVTTTSAAITTLPAVEGPAKALVTPTGVVVAVLDETPAGFVVSSPCGNETLVSTGTPISSADVVIDPGHGGEIDTGAHGANGLIERDLNLTVSQAVEAKLIVRGIPVLLTRTANYASTLSVRAALADAVDAELLLSVHHNAPTPGPSSRPGTEVFIQHDSSDSRRLGGLVWRSVVQALSRFDVDWVAAPDAGVLSVLSTRGEDAYGINRNTETVSVLAELGYISNPAEAGLFTSNAYVEAAAEALADAIEDYLKTEEPGSGFIEEPRVFNPQPGIGARVCEDPELE
jgi:N-acetylmuramoyl-L-alanine amidase